ncbi:MAG: hypothetical protein Q8P05_05760 [Candidatus Diapherotrites archaeon]|nr:hypothetical protein [Candidatus Diapherotrites archaeon]MDZ4256838.1 hypothetical protein [archaeon]
MMTLETWMHHRKKRLLTEKKEALFQAMRSTPDFHRKRAALYETLTRLEHYRREERMTPHALASLGIPFAI